MQVVKRDGQREKLDLSKIRKQTFPACEGLDGVSPEDLEFSLSKVIKDGVKSSEIQKALINAASDNVDVDKPNWNFVAARLSLYDLYHIVKHKHNKAVSGNVYGLVSLEDYLRYVYDLGLTKYSAQDFIGMGFDLEAINKEIVADRDKQFTYMGVELLRGRYLLRDKNKENVELPQHMFIHIAMILAVPEEEDRTEWAIKFYHVLSKFEAMVATPTLTNLRKKFSNCFSCYVGSTADNLESIFDSYKEQALISKWGGGLGWDWSRVRSLNGPIQNTKELAKGKIPWLKMENDLAIAVDQLGQRPGAINTYVSDWDKDVFDFLDLKKSGGEERRTAEDLFITISITDVFMNRVMNDEEFTLFDPYDVPELNEMYGNEFKERYEYYERGFKDGSIEFWNTPRTIKAKNLMKHILKYMFDVGLPFLFFKDNVNEAHRHPEEGIIRTSNLCMEINQPTDEDRTAICNLASVNLSKVHTVEKIVEVVPIVVRMLDNVNDVTDYILYKHEKHQKTTRAIGLGIMGEAQLVAEKGIMYGGVKHKKLIDKLYKNIYTIAENSSELIGKEKGVWKEGKTKRNAYLSAIAPTSSIALLTATSPSHEPVFKKFWLEDGMFGKVPIVAPNLNPNNYSYYVNAYDINQIDMLELTSIRQKYVDQSISHNLYFKPEETTAKTILEAIIYAWMNNVKTIYYTRTKSKEVEKESDRIRCHGCE